jgi:coat protein
MARKFINLPSVLNVAVGNTFILDVPVGGLTYEQIILDLGANITDAEITNIRVKINGEEIQFYADGTTLEDLNDYYGRPNTATFLSIFFSRPEMADLKRERLTALGTLDIQTLTIEGDIDAGAAGATISAYALVSEPTKLGSFTRVRRFPFNFAGSGQVEMTGITFGPPILGMHFQKSDVSDVLIEDSSKAVVRMPKLILNHIQEGYSRAPVTALFTHVDFGLEGDPAQVLLTAGRDKNGVVRTRDLRIQPTLGSSGAINLIVEYLDTL